MEKKHVKRLFLPHNALADGDESEYYKRLIAAAEKNKTEVTYLSAGDEIMFGEDIRVQCVFPDKTTSLSGNEGALVLNSTYGESEFLFTGDIGFEAEKALMESGADIDADIIKIAHHGSKYSSDGAFIDAVSPKIALISAGRNNTYGHPTAEVLEKLSDRNIAVYNTQQNGAVLIQTDGKNLFIKTMAEQSDF
jgi:competence protein ComEC